jgi:DNA polymerase III alpha subunit (gram-positive type)
MNQAIVIFDCETGELSCEENPITQIALIAIDSVTLKEINRFECFVKPYENLIIEKEALEGTQVSLSDINRGIEVKELVRVLIKFFESLTPKGDRGKNKPLLAGHNVTFDIAFLSRAFDFCRKDLSEYVHSNNKIITYLDTLPLSRIRFSQKGKFRLGLVCERFGIELNDAHGAMNDVVATMKVLLEHIKSLRGESKEDSNKTFKNKRNGVQEESRSETSEYRARFQF